MLVIMLSAGCSKQDIAQTEDGTFVLGSIEESTTTERGITPGTRTVFIDGFNGNIQLDGVTGETANFVFTKKARGADAGNAIKLLDKISIEEAGDESTFALTLSSPEEERSAVDIVATIPFNTPIVLKTTSGEISLSMMSGSIEVSNVAGNVTYTGNSSSLKLQTRNGDIVALLTEPSRLTKGVIETSNGDIMISLPLESSIEVEATTSAGSVRNTSFSFASRSLASNGAGAHFKGMVGSETDAKLMAKTYHGDISFRTLSLSPAMEEMREDGTAEADEMNGDHVEGDHVEGDDAPGDTDAPVQTPADSTAEPAIDAENIGEIPATPVPE